jgi:putative toxin-antitoxin system antitoxin component (TIGR02293 family)
MEREDMVVSADMSAAYADYLSVVQSTIEDRIERVRRGLPPSLVMQLAHDLCIPDHSLALYLGLSRATLRRRIAENERLTSKESEGPLALAAFAGKVILECTQPLMTQAMVGDPLRWLGQWLSTPVADLDGRAPLQYMDVVEGRALVATWLDDALSPASPP